MRGLSAVTAHGTREAFAKTIFFVANPPATANFADGRPLVIVVKTLGCPRRREWLRNFE